MILRSQGEIAGRGSDHRRRKSRAPSNVSGIPAARSARQMVAQSPADKRPMGRGGTGGGGSVGSSIGIHSVIVCSCVLCAFFCSMGLQSVVSGGQVHSP